MDEAVLRALARWPNVPACHGWLSLDRRGRWRMQGEAVTHPGLADFIGRNYACDDTGCWYTQNGPQKVFITLAYTPWILRTTPTGFVTHTGAGFVPQAGWTDEEGNLLLSGPLGIGLVHDHDLGALADTVRLPEDDVPGRIELPSGALSLVPIRAAEVPTRFGFTPSPQPA
ncbi:DUF2946 family protein [Niveibacterium sp. SC-1]|uniref:DUF2946 family protein n=1 Tax=Niveibacterium sp. SC-1 TaxID=3135646 RepID=UPI00311D6728